MKFSEFITRNADVSLTDVVPLLEQIYVNAHNWNVDDSIKAVLNNKSIYVIHKLLVPNISNKVILGELIYEHYIEYDEDGEVNFCSDFGNGEIPLCYEKSYVNVKSLVEYMISDLKDLNLIPSELLTVAGIKIPNTKHIPDQCKPEPAIATELGTLRNEKLKWDTSVKAATEIGLQFFEGKLPIPTTKENFVKEFNSKVGGLPDTTIEMIYKALPSEYRHKGGKPKVSKTETAAITGIGDLNTVIKAAVYAGSLHETRDAKDVSRLTTMLKENSFQVPPVTVLEKIVECVKDI